MVNEVTLYRIPNCDTIKKAKTWLSNHDLEFKFHDYRKQGIDNDQLYLGFSAPQYQEIFG